jgi:RNA polymerase sigma factor (sigma-70 family)
MDALTNRLVSMSSVLTETEYAMVVLRFQHQFTQCDIAEEVGLSQQRVAQLLEGALSKLRNTPNLILDFPKSEN